MNTSADRKNRSSRSTSANSSSRHAITRSHESITFSHLPNELFEEIAKLLCTKDKASLCLVSKRLCEATIRRLYRHICILQRPWMSLNNSKKQQSYFSDSMIRDIEYISPYIFTFTKQQFEYFTKNAETMWLSTNPFPFQDCQVVDLLQLLMPKVERLHRLELFVSENDPTSNFIKFTEPFINKNKYSNIQVQHLSLVFVSLLANHTIGNSINTYRREREPPETAVSTTAAFVNSISTLRSLSLTFKTSYLYVETAFYYGIDDADFIEPYHRLNRSFVAKFLDALTIINKEVKFSIDYPANLEDMTAIRKFCGKNKLVAYDHPRIASLEHNQPGHTLFYAELLGDVTKAPDPDNNDRDAAYFAWLGPQSSAVPTFSSAQCTLRELCLDGQVVNDHKAMRSLAQLRPCLEILILFKSDRNLAATLVLNSEVSRLVFSSAWPLLRILKLIRLAVSPDILPSHYFTSRIGPHLHEFTISLNKAWSNELAIALMSLHRVRKLRLDLNSRVPIGHVINQTIHASNCSRDQHQVQLMPLIETLVLDRVRSKDHKVETNAANVIKYILPKAKEVIVGIRRPNMATVMIARSISRWENELERQNARAQMQQPNQQQW
ncbi:hypothetical protein GQ42DRAFT_169983 [Ramicandelaber brevisporus]|nr:hypothetical protein GQ42DRAFT_169983 [Ramicandelaber brevisporus]